MAERDLHSDSVLVIGLGRFGASVAESLASLGHDVLAIERDPELVRKWAPVLTHVVEADATQPESLSQLGAEEFPIAVVGIGSSIEASVLSTANLVDMGCKQIWAKAISMEHGRILERIGAHHAVFPEYDMGEKVAHLVSGRLMDYMSFEDGYAIVKMRPPLETQGFTLAESQVRKKYGVTVVGIKSPGEDFEYASSDTRITGHDVLIVSGDNELIERFAARP
ncbi:MAG: potassium transporter [Micrococcales bacterium]|nr:MAG: potassium transporter [Micrococcales bacterium]PIE25932.1 MAG: potassium transporter [Micrococcales bacterium]